MGVGAGDEAHATFVELAVPFLLGAVLGIAGAVTVVHLAIDRLDTLRNLQPPAHVVLDVRSVVVALGGRGVGARRARDDRNARDDAGEADGGDAQCGMRPWSLHADLVRRFTAASGIVTALDGVDLAVEAGSFTVVAGPSGSGKSVLLSMISCTDRPSAGTVRVDDQVVSDLGRRARRRFRRDRLGIVLPQPSDNLLDHLNAGDNVRSAARVRRAPASVAEEASALMEVVGIGSVGGKAVRQLSGGEQQRLALVCALVGDPLLLVADEPTASLDAASSLAVVSALRALGDRGVTMVVATHDSHVIEAADSVIRLDHGRRVA